MFLYSFTGVLGEGQTVMSSSPSGSALSHPDTHVQPLPASNQLRWREHQTSIQERHHLPWRHGCSHHHLLHSHCESWVFNNGGLNLCFLPHHWKLIVICFLHRSPQERPTWCTPNVSTPTPSSTSTCLLSTKSWAPSCLAQPSASLWLTWQSSPSVVLVQTSWRFVTQSAVPDTCCTSTALEALVTWLNPGRLQLCFTSSSVFYHPSDSRTFGFQVNHSDVWTHSKSLTIQSFKIRLDKLDLRIQDKSKTLI